jgi:GntR family transcriptional regulator
MKDAAKVKGRTKRTAARLAIGTAIGDGVLAPGNMLPPEVELARIMGVSLGTIQVALRQLQDTGVIVRRRGDGTRIASTEPLDPSVWHFRFIRLSDGTPVHPVADWIRIETAGPSPLLCERLGEHAEFQRIRRRYSATGCAPFGSEMYISPSLGLHLDPAASDDLRMLNIRTHLERRFNIVAAGTDQTVRLSVVEDLIAATFEMQRFQMIYEIAALTTGREGRPIYFQRIYVPAEHYALNFTNSVRP